VAEPISHVNVWSGRDEPGAAPDDELIVTWRGGSPDVSVFVSEDPLDAGTDVRAPDRPQMAVVPRSDRRLYFHLFDPEHGFTVAAERRLHLDGTSNFRDIGGYPTTDGFQSAWGRVFRSGRLDELTDRDHEVLADLGISVVFDLRSEAEVERQPDRLWPGVRHIHLPMSSDVAVKRGFLERIIGGHIREFTKTQMADGYLRMLESYPQALGRIAKAVADGERILIHCTAGKDRTGIAAMLLLGIASVDDGLLLDDYEISARYRTPGIVKEFSEQVRAAGLDPDDFDIDAMLGSPRSVMRRTLDGLYERWGDHHGYARFAGLDDDRLQAVRRRLRV